MSQSRRSDAQQLARALRERRASHEIDTLLKWLAMLYEVAKENLVSASPDTISGLQGEARVIKRMIGELTRPVTDPETSGGA